MGLLFRHMHVIFKKSVTKGEINILNIHYVNLPVISDPTSFAELERISGFCKKKKEKEKEKKKKKKSLLLYDCV